MSNNEGHVHFGTSLSTTILFPPHTTQKSFHFTLYLTNSLFSHILSTKIEYIVTSMTSENASVSATATSKSQEQLERKSRWASKRERERNKSRFEISQRIQRIVDGVNDEEG